jgi:outer membrane protein OmpA-like peptidoglycan-associated protein
MATKFNIRPEAFEFDPELDEYQSNWGQFEGGFGEYEGGEPASATACPPYQPGEVAKSRTHQGHLPADFIDHADGKLIADFGVDWRTPKSALRSDAALKAWLATMVQVVRANPDTKIWVKGYSDCVGRENNNQFLRRGRALRVQQLLRQLAGPQWSVLRPKIVFTGAAPAGEYVADNGTVEGRARNRGVLIVHKRVIDQEPEQITVPAPVGPCDFRPSRNGFKFGNLFTLPSAITDALSRLGIPIGKGEYGLCGGMSLLAADLFSFRMSVPSTATVPPLGSSLYNKLLERQLDSLKLKLMLVRGAPVPLPVLPPGFAAPVMKFWRWMGLPDTGPGSIAEKTAAEVATINSILRRRKFAVLGLVLANRSGSLTDNHQVLAYCMGRSARSTYLYAIYDPNHPLRDDVRIEAQIVGKEVRAVHIEPTAGSTMARHPVRGFFNMTYSPKRP